VSTAGGHGGDVESLLGIADTAHGRGGRVMLDTNGFSRRKLLCVAAASVSVLASACSATAQHSADSRSAPSTVAHGSSPAHMATAQRHPLHASAHVLAARGAIVRTGDGASLSIGAHVLQRNGTASIHSTNGKVYDFNIWAPWIGHVTVALPVSTMPSGAHLFLVHRIRAHAWLAENAVLRGGHITAEVSHLSPFKMVICLRGVNIRDCLAKQLVLYVAEKLVGGSIKRVIDDVANQCGNIIDGTPACKLGDGSLPPSLAPHGPNPTIAAPTAPVHGGNVPIQGGSVPIQGSNSSDQRSWSAHPQPASRFHGGFSASVDKYATTGDSGHEGPGDQYAAGPTHPAGTTIHIYCHVNGQSITNSHYNDTTTIWDLSDDGYWYTDAWLFTKSNGPLVPACR
jgi:hypothetical protein